MSTSISTQTTVERIEPNEKWIRGMVGDRTVVDTRAAMLVWEHRYYPHWYIPITDIHDDSLPTVSMPEIDALAGHVKVEWSAIDRWFEEDVEVFVHPRSPYTRIDALPSSRRVTVSIGGTVIADSRRPTMLFETGLPTRYYVPADDVRLDLLTPTETSTGCPYKGLARYWTATIDGEEYPDVAWGYDDPLPESAPIQGLICFYPEQAEIVVE